MSYYLYGAAVQGIQSFIFQSNELAKIAEYSELVEYICTTLFKEAANKRGEEVIQAAGNVKHIFNCKKDCEEVVLEFPRKVMITAPGITVSQAVVEFEDVTHFGYAVNKLEDKLRAERNRRAVSLTAGLLGMYREPKTGLPKRENFPEKEDTENLRQRSFYGKNSDEKVTHVKGENNINNFTGKNDWIAVVHADGNGMGAIVREIGRNKNEFSIFSKNLDKATEKAANNAFAKVRNCFGQFIPIRPVVLGGDDMTVILRADLAIDYVKAYLEEFEKSTEEIAGRKLTACAGIAFIKSSYPFYYGYNLAEELCSAAKEASNREHSCMMFHKVQDSFVLDYKDIVKRELSPKEGPSLQFGPYYVLNEAPADYMSIKKLMELADELNKEENEGVRTGIRQWLTLLHDGNGRASQHLGRLIEINSEKDKSEKDKKVVDELIKPLTETKHGAVPALDCLTLYTIKNQTTKEEYE